MNSFLLAYRTVIIARKSERKSIYRGNGFKFSQIKRPDISADYRICFPRTNIMRIRPASVFVIVGGPCMRNAESFSISIFYGSTFRTPSQTPWTTKKFSHPKNDIRHDIVSFNPFCHPEDSATRWLLGGREALAPPSCVVSQLWHSEANGASETREDNHRAGNNLLEHPATPCSAKAMGA